jgi:TolB protein
MRRGFIAATAALLSAGCGTATATLDGASEPDRLGQVHHELGARIEEKFGKGARLQRMFGFGDSALLGIALEEKVEESDVRQPLALAQYQAASGTLTVIAQQAEFREALVLPASTALLTASGELKLRAQDGAERTVASHVKGDLVQAPAGVLLFTAEHELGGEGETAVMLAGADGTQHTLADGEGVDDRASVSSDGVTVVFVSGRSGIASLWRTTLEGAAPVQLTNAAITAGVEREGEPEGFVPPPVSADRLEWVSADVVRYDAGDGELWEVNVRTGAATREGGAP